MYVITGASDGLGLALAKVLAKKGVRIVSLSRSKPKAKGVEHIPCDLTNEGSINAAAEQVLAIGESIQALVNCAGIYGEEPVEALTGRSLALEFTTNIIGPEILTSRLFERLVLDGADIVNVSSIMATRGDDYAAAHTSSKWAMRGFSRVLQTRLKDTPCRVVSFCPGAMNTGIFKKGGVDFDASECMQPADVAQFMVQILALPKNMEVSEVLINCKRS